MRSRSAVGKTASRLRRFRKNREGATAIEFALVAAPFFALVFAIIETALVFFAGQVLDTGVSEAARLVRTGQAQQQGFDQNALKAQLCSKVGGLFNCGGLKLDVRTHASFSNINLAKPIDGDGNLDEGSFTFQPGAGGEIVVVRAFYEWPTFVPGFGNDLGDLANGKRLLASAAAFRNEPF